MTIQSRIIDYSDSKTVYKGYLAWDDAITGPRPAILIAHTWAGRAEFECEKARRLAELGYTAFAIDMFGEGRQGSNNEENAGLIQPLVEDRPELQKRMVLALNTVREQPEVDPRKVAAMGFCFGGLCVLDLARTGTDVLGVVSFHGILAPPGNTEGNNIAAKVLCLHGYDDPMAEPQSVLDLAGELTRGGADWQVHAYGNTVHAFTNPDANDPGFGTVYNPVADKRSWQSLTNFLTEIFA